MEGGKGWRRKVSWPIAASCRLFPAVSISLLAETSHNSNAYLEIICQKGLLLQMTAWNHLHFLKGNKKQQIPSLLLKYMCSLIKPTFLWFCSSALTGDIQDMRRHSDIRGLKVVRGKGGTGSAWGEYRICWGGGWGQGIGSLVREGAPGKKEREQSSFLTMLKC